VKAHYDSIHGRISSEWRRTEKQFELTVEIPANTTATVILPAANLNAVSSLDLITESGKPLAKAKGVTFLRMEGNFAVLAVESGKYHFVTGN